MSGVEVAAIVASILAALGNGMDMFKRMRAKQKARKQDKQGPKLTADEARLQQSLSRGPQQIRTEYDRSVISLGHRFQVGDTAAQTSLNHTLLVFNTGLASIIHHALSEDPKAREMSKRSLLGLSELATANTLNSLDQLNKRLSSVPGLALQTQLQLRMPHRKKRKPVQPKDPTSCASRTSPAEPKAKKRPGPDLITRGGWVRSKSGTSVISSASSTPRPAKQTSNHSSFSSATDELLSHARPRPQHPHLAYNHPPCICGAHVPTTSHELGRSKYDSQSYVPPQSHEPDLLLASPDVFSTDYLPPRPPKIPIERPVASRKPRPPSVATFLTASTKIGEIPERKWLGRPTLPLESGPLPYVIPPPLEPEPIKRKTRGFRSWWKTGGRDEKRETPEE